MITFDFCKFCEDGKEILLNGVIAEEIRFSEIIDHSRNCPVCKSIVDEYFQKMIGNIPPTFQPFVRSMLKSIGG